MDTPKLGIIYVRVSSDLQMQKGSGLESQETICRERATRQGIQVIGVFSDGGVSGKLLSREGLDKMIAYLKVQNKNYTKIQYVIVDDIDRVSRDVELWRQIKRNIEISGSKLYSLKMSLDNTPESVLQQNILMSMKQFERQNNARRVKDRQRARMLDGYRPLYPPMGYKHIEGSSKKKVLELVKPDAFILQEALELFAAGMFVSKEDLRKYLTQQSFGTRRSGKTTRSFVDRLLEERMLLFYAGYIEYKPWDVHMVSAQHPAIIDKDLVYKILARLSPRELYKKYTYSYVDEKLPLRSVVVCECCGYPLTGGPSTNRHGTTYFYYSCRQKTCEMYGKSFSAPIVHQEFETLLQSLRIKPSVISLLKEVAKNITEHKIASVSFNTNQARKKIRELDKSIGQVEERVFSATDSKLISLYEKKLTDLLGQKQELEYSLKAHKNTENIPADSLFDDTRPLLENPSGVWHDCDIEMKRIFIGVLFNKKMSYGKISGLGTSETPLVYRDFSLLGTDNSHLVEMVGFEPTSKRHT